MWLAALLDEQMHQQRLTQVDIADRVGVSQAAVSRWVIGKGLPKPGQAVRLAWALGLEPLSFMGELWPEVAEALADLSGGALNDSLEQLGEADSEYDDEVAAAADTGRPGPRGRRFNRPSPEPEPEGP
jgi:transcriptional regulator with XRE-family HTH domain